MIRSLEYELHTLRERNQRGASPGARMALAAREKEQRETTRALLRKHLGEPPPRHVFPPIDRPGFTVTNRITVTLTRMSPGTLDDDGTPDALKNARDGVADWLGIDDSKRGGVEWRYQQEKTAAGVHRVRVEVQDATTGTDVRKVLASDDEHRAGALQRVRPKKPGRQALLPARPSFADLPWERPPCPECKGIGWHLIGSSYTDCGTCEGAKTSGRRLAPLPRYSREHEPPARIDVPVPHEHRERHGATITLHRRPARFKATGEIWLYEQEKRP